MPLGTIICTECGQDILNGQHAPECPLRHSGGIYRAVNTSNERIEEGQIIYPSDLGYLSRKIIIEYAPSIIQGSAKRIHLQLPSIPRPQICTLCYHPEGHFDNCPCVRSEFPDPLLNESFTIVMEVIMAHLSQIAPVTVLYREPVSDKECALYSAMMVKDHDVLTSGFYRTPASALRQLNIKVEAKRNP